MTPAAIAAQLDHWPFLGPVTPTLINLSENHTYRLDGADGRRHILRVHRPGYQDSAAIQSELAWIGALASQTDILVPTPLAGADGALLQTLDFPSEAGRRHAVLFAFDAGAEPDEDRPDLPALFEQLGAIAATCHVQVQNWTPPAGFARPLWTVSNMLDADGLWGDWRAAPNLDAAGRRTLERAASELAVRFDAYGRAPDRFGLIHADMRLANLLVHENRIRLLDFDDSGFGWFVYDFAAAISFFELSPRIPELKRSWCAGYERIRALGAADKAMLDPAILLRRMLLLAWIGSHGETDLARALQGDFAAGSVELAERFLDQGRLF